MVEGRVKIASRDMIMKECRWGIVCSGEPGGVWMATLRFLLRYNTFSKYTR